jgi:hypothetical protein
MPASGNSAAVANTNQALLTDLLKQVSRSFYLTLRVLPSEVRPQIGLAYLLARTTDTIADTEILPRQDRLNALGLLRARIFGHKREPINFSAIAAQQGSPAECALLERVEESLTLLQTLTPEDVDLVRKVIDTITSGQEMDLLRFGGVAKRTTTPSTSKERGAKFPSREGSGVGCPNKSSPFKPTPNWTTTPTVSPVAWASSGPRYAARICFQTQNWMTLSCSRTAFALAKDCNSSISCATCRAICNKAVATFQVIHSPNPVYRLKTY